MTEKEIREIYDRLLDLTKTRAIRWKKTEESEYMVSFSRSSVTVGKDYDRDIEIELIALRIFNEEGLLVAYASLRDLEEDEEVKQFIFDPSKLFDLVQNEVYKYSETSENILNELRELELQKGR
jgi:hypothetical protein